MVKKMQESSQAYIAKRNSNNSKNILTVALYALMLIYAVSFTMIGPMMSILIRHYQLRISQGGLMVTYQSIGGIVSIILGGILADNFKKSKLIGIGFGLYSIALFVISLTPSYLLLLMVFFILGASTKLVDTVTNSYIADLHSDNRGKFLNFLHVFFGAGALIGPLFSRYLISKGVNWSQCFLYLWVASTAIFLIYIAMLLLIPDLHDKKSSTVTTGFLKVLSNLKIWILCLIIFMYAGHQSGINIWFPMYAETVLKVSTLLSSLSLSIFWAGIILGRLLCIKLQQKYNVRHILFLGSLLGGSVLISGILTQNPSLILASVGLAALFTGATIPMLIAIACSLFPRNSGAASSILFFNNSIAWILFPWLIGIIAEYSNFQSGMLLTGVSLLITSLASIAIPSTKDDIDG